MKALKSTSMFYVSTKSLPFPIFFGFVYIFVYLPREIFKIETAKCRVLNFDILLPFVFRHFLIFQWFYMGFMFPFVSRMNVFCEFFVYNNEAVNYTAINLLRYISLGKLNGFCNISMKNKREDIEVKHFNIYNRMK